MNYVILAAQCVIFAVVLANCLSTKARLRRDAYPREATPFDVKRRAMEGTIGPEVVAAQLTTLGYPDDMVQLVQLLVKAWCP